MQICDKGRMRWAEELDSSEEQLALDKGSREEVGSAGGVAAHREKKLQ